MGLNSSKDTVSCFLGIETRKVLFKALKKFPNLWDSLTTFSKSYFISSKKPKKNSTEEPFRPQDFSILERQESGQDFTF
jgi:hypothetical protein